MGRKSVAKPNPKHKKGLWSPDEDEKLKSYIVKHGLRCWSSIATNAGLQRNGKSCRLRWINYLRPGLKRGPFTFQEDETILTLHQALGNKWSQIAHYLPGRTDNEIKNYWHTHLKKITLVSNTETDQSCSSKSQNEKVEEFMSQGVDKLRGSVTKCNLPILFAEWQSLDNHSPSMSSASNTTGLVEDSSANLKDCLVSNVLMNEGMPCSKVQQNSSSVVSFDDDMLDELSAMLMLDDQIPEVGSMNYFSDDFTTYMYKGEIS